MLTVAKRANDPNLEGRDVLILLNSTGEGSQFTIPFTKISNWQLFLDTSLEFPGDIYPELDGPKLKTKKTYTLPAKAMAVFVST